MKKKFIYILILVLIIFFSGFNIYRTSIASSEVPQVQVTKLTPNEMTTEIITKGRVVLEEELVVTYDATKGIISDILVNKGDQVQKGDTLLTYENRELQLRKKLNDITVEGLYLQVNNHINNEKVINEKINKAKKDSMEEMLLSSLESELSQVKMNKRLTDLELRKALLEKEEIDKQLDELEIKSSIDGEILFTSSSLEHNNTVLLIGGDQIYIEGEVSEFDLVHLENGQKVEITSESIMDTYWSGTITKINELPTGYHEGRYLNDQPRYTIIVSFDNREDTKVYPGFHMTLQIETSKYTAQTLPLTAIVEGENGSVVFVVNDGTVQEREISTGEIKGNVIEITDGLQEDDLVIVNPISQQIKIGMEVDVND